MHLWRLIILVGFILTPLLAQAGGSGVNVLVVVNQNSTNSLELGNYYCEKRGVPSQNLIRVSWTGGNTTWTYSDYRDVILNPVLNAIATRSLTNQIRFVVLSMDFPYQVTRGGDSSEAGINSSTSPLFYGFKADEPAPAFPGAPRSCFLPYASSNSFAASEQAFQFARPDTAPTNSFLATMLTSTSLAAAKSLVDRGVASDSTFPSEPVLLAHGADPFRNVRYWTFDDAIFNTRLRSGYLMYETNLDSPSWFVNLLGFETGLHSFGANSNNFIPGGIADSLTSYGGLILQPNDQTSLLAFINGGATASYGTVEEPCNYLDKFPSPQVYFYQSRGFTIGESYYQSITNPYQGLMVGEPLAAPFARPASLTWSNLTDTALLSGTTNLTLSVTAATSNLPVCQVDLFIDGVFHQTITNIVPGVGNELTVSVAGISTNYVVPTNATIGSVVSNLTLTLNGSSFSNSAGMRAFAHGDRIELKSSIIGRNGTQTSLSSSNSPGSTTRLKASGPNFLDSPARGRRAYYLTNPPAPGDYLLCVVIKTNGQVVTAASTNTSGATTLAQFAKAFFSAINTNAALQGADGIAIEDIVMHEDYSYAFGASDYAGDYNIRARATGWQASQVQVSITGSPGCFPTGTNALDDNVEDLQPRAHLYVSVGMTNSTLPFSLSTTGLADGYHELSAIAYEGTHVRTQARSASNARIQNTAVSATLTMLYGGSSTTLGTTLQFQVTANTNASKIELFSTGGLVGTSTNQSSSVFSVVGLSLGAGLHPFYAVVTSSDGKVFRTAPTYVRLVVGAVPFQLQIAAPPPLLSWPAIAGRTYEVYSTLNLTQPFQSRATVTPSNSVGQWVETNAGPAAFYRVQTIE